MSSYFCLNQRKDASSTLTRLRRWSGFAMEELQPPRYQISPYRLGMGRRFMLGVVGPYRQLSPEKIEAQLRENGAGWLLAGIPALKEARTGRGGVASFQWTEGTHRAVRLGDAIFARDTLASQGIVVGASEALRVAGQWPASAVGSSQYERGRVGHLQELLRTIRRCRHRCEQAWSEYERSICAAVLAVVAGGPELQLLEELRPRHGEINMLAADDHEDPITDPNGIISADSAT
jgi:hypothetical protein